MKKKITNKKTKDITISDLAAMVAKGFAGVDKRFDEVDQRFDHVETRVSHIEKTLLGMDGKLAELDKRMKNVEEVIEPLVTGYRIMQNEVREILSRIHRLEKKAGIEN